MVWFGLVWFGCLKPLFGRTIGLVGRTIGLVVFLLNFYDLSTDLLGRLFRELGLLGCSFYGENFLELLGNLSDAGNKPF